MDVTVVGSGTPGAGKSVGERAGESAGLKAGVLTGARVGVNAGTNRSAVGVGTKVEAVARRLDGLALGSACTLTGRPHFSTAGSRSGEEATDMWRE